MMVCEYDACPDHDGPCRMWAGKPDLTCLFGGKQVFGSTTLEGGPGAAQTAPDLADPSVEGASDGER